MAYNVSNNWNEKVVGNNKQYASYLLVNNNYIPMQQISKIHFIEEIIDKENEYMYVGTFRSNQMDITFKTLNNIQIASNLPVYCEIGLNTDYQSVNFTYNGVNNNGYKLFTIDNEEDLQYFKKHYYVNITINGIKYERLEILDIDSSGANSIFTIDLYQVSEILPSDSIVIYPFEYVPKGNFLIDEPEENYHKTCKITCLDYGIKLKTPVDYSSAFVDGKITLKNLLIWLCNYYGVTLGTYPNVNNNIEIGVYDSTLSGKTYVSYIAEMFGGNVKFDRDGVLNIIPLKQNVTKTINALKTKSFDLGEKFKISKVVYQDAVRIFNPGDDTANTLYIRPENMFVPDSQAIENIYNAVKNFEIYSLSNELRSDVSIDCWDIVNYSDGENLYPTYYNNTTTFQTSSLMTKVETKIPSKQQEITTNVIGANEDTKLSIVKATLDLVKKSIELLVENIGDNGQVTAASIMLAINDDTSVIKLDADKVNLTANDIINLIANNQINISTKNISITSDNFSVSAIGEIMAKLGKIGGWNIDTNKLYSNTTNNKVTGMASSDWPGDPIFFAGGGNPYETSDWVTSVPFYVTNQGKLKASDAEITGTINTSNATITGGSIKLVTANMGNTIQVGKDNRLHTIMTSNGLGVYNSSTQELAILGDSLVTNGTVSAKRIYGKNIQSGSCVLKSSDVVQVDFNFEFEHVPSVVITPYTSASGVIAPKIREVTTTYFKAIIGGSGFSGIDCNWIAISS